MLGFIFKILITFFTLTIGIFAQSNWTVDGGLFSNHAPNIISINRESRINENLSWYFSSGLPGIFVLGLEKNLKKTNNYQTQFSGSIGFDPSIDGFFRLAWTQTYKMSDKLTWSWGIHLPIVMIGYGSRFDENDKEVTGWKIETIASTAGSIDASSFIPLPIVNIAYDF